uniref:PC3-like endoprotease variant B n=1 Tax=Callorhinchus milii TaxID=7868 RepID=A0A4W3K9M7_CALMI
MDEDWSINGAGYHVHHKSIAISTEHPLILNLTTDGCTGTENEVDSLEHVQVTVSLSSICRGDLSIFLTSPYGTVSQLLGIREADNSKEGLTNWTFTTVHSWGEDPKGTWKLTVKDDSVYTFGCRRRYSETTAGFITQFKLTLWGTYRTKFPKKEKLKHSGVLYNRYNLQESLTEFIENSQVNLELAEAFVSENIKRVNEADIPSVKTKKKASVNNSPSALSSEFGKYLLHLWSAFWNSTTSESNSAIEGERSEPASPLVDARALHEGTANTGQR